MLSLLYVSVSTLSKDMAFSVVERIVTQANIKNARLGITGALIFTGTEFAQVLEGKEDQVNALMREICVDSRHRRITVVKRRPITVRRFAAWSLAYSGGATYIRRPIQQLLQPLANEQVGEIDRIDALMDELATNLA